MKKSIFDSVFAVTGGLIGFLFGELDGLFYALIAMVTLDFGTGFLGALVIKKNASSQVGFKGIVKKVYMFAIVALAHIIDIQVVGGGGVLRSAVISFFIANEALSILENAGSLGLPIPKKLLRALEQLRNSNEKEEKT